MKHLFIGTALSMIQVSLKNHQVVHDYATSTRVKFVTHIVTTTSDSKYLFFGSFNNLSQFEINDSSHKLIKRYHYTSNVNCVLITPDNKYLFAGLDSGDIDHIDLETHALVIRYNAVT
jgi:WD40 repeat protein